MRSCGGCGLPPEESPKHCALWGLVRHDRSLGVSITDALRLVLQGPNSVVIWFITKMMRAFTCDRTYSNGNLSNNDLLNNDLLALAHRNRALI
jgi:hypothetical protein